MPKFTWLRGLGPLGTFVANLLAFLTANWGVAVSAAVAIYVALSEWAAGVVHNPTVQAAAITFLVLLWGYIGITFLIDRHYPRAVRAEPDYRYGLTFEGIIPNIDILNEDGWLSFGLQVRNFSQAPIRYRVESVDFRIGSRALPKADKQLIGYLPRGGGKIFSPSSFKKDDVREFFGKRVHGTAEYSICYGHPEREPERRLRIELKITLHLQENNVPPIMGFGGDIIREDDEPYEGRALNLLQGNAV
jgi:hypothetical protein